MAGLYLALAGACLAEYRFERSVTEGNASTPSTSDTGENEATAETSTSSGSGSGSGSDTASAEGESSDDGATLQCNGKRIPCAGVCIDPRHDPQNCGGCGWNCGAMASCRLGVCERSCEFGCEARTQICEYDQCRCREPLVGCGPYCVDLASDPGHCGGCGTNCDPTQVCSAGICMPLCPSTLTQCQGGCVDLATHPLHCGACDRDCPASDACVRGMCVSPEVLP